MKAGMKAKLCAAILAVAAVTPALAHRLDEYLQGTILSIGKTQVQGQMTLTPGVAVFPFLIADIDSDGDGAISETEQRAYAERVLRICRSPPTVASWSPGWSPFSFPRWTK